ncbi:MAG: hypothetical protein Q8Q08_04465 [Candidatus Omnitrophota bacterium]|nr:hypothetical protein [Candidatus Omnitrophota bacterium]MDZ4242579.1 hypothetical protein [Candidatus Omnitrophota bacterium]
MKKNDALFAGGVLLGLSLLAGVAVENTRSVLDPRRVDIVIDVAKVKAGIEKAGLVPYDAKYWKTLK